MNDNEYLEQMVNFCKLLPNLFPSDVAVTVTDLKKHIFMGQAKTFHMNLNVNDPIREGGGLEKAIKTNQIVIARLPESLYGFPVATHTIPLHNKDRNTIIGALSVAISLERETAVMNMAEELLEFSTSLQTFASNLSESGERLSSQSLNMNNDINLVSDEITKMDNIIGYIKSISETSNLLGLNASIEAARAGDAGRGFAVVAEEIRKLATTSKESSVEILNSLNDLKNNINGLINGIQEFSEISIDQTKQTKLITEESKELSHFSEKLAAISKELA